MRKTKIICTLGPATDNEAVLKGLMENGMNVARINMSHQSHADQKVRIDTVKRLREELNLPVAILIDTKGPEIRLGVLKEKVLSRCSRNVDELWRVIKEEFDLFVRHPISVEKHSLRKMECSLNKKI